MGLTSSSTNFPTTGVLTSNPSKDLLRVEGFHHVEFWCGDASNTWRRFAWGLGMQLVAKSDQQTGNQTYCSYVLRSNELVLAFTAPYSCKIEEAGSHMPHPCFSASDAHAFFDKHGVAVRALGVLVDDANEAFRVSVENGAIPVLSPCVLADKVQPGNVTMSEVKLYGDVVLRFVSRDNFQGPFLPGYETLEALPLSCGLLRLDHAVGNVYKLMETAKEIAAFTGFHQSTELTAKDMVKEDMDVNTIVLADPNEMVVLPLNAPTFGACKSQVQAFLEHNEGPGLQHLAFVCNDIFSTVQEMQMRSQIGGFDFLPKPPPAYYEHLYEKLKPSECEKGIIRQCEELGILVDKDEQGLVLQIFTKPVGDRPTLFLEITERISCTYEGGNSCKHDKGRNLQQGGCGGFGKGNCATLFKIMEDYKKTYGTKS